MNVKKALDKLLATFREDQLREVLNLAPFVNARMKRDPWRHFGASQFSQCYGPAEPEYTPADLKPELNP